MAQKRSPFLRILAMVLLSLTAAMTLLGGIGTSCVAFSAEKFGARMAALIPVKPIFQVLVFISIAAAIYGIYSIVRLGKGRRGAYNQALIFLVVGLLASGVQYYYSLTLRGSTAPNNVRLYLTGLTLAALLAMRLPGIWQRSGFGDADAPGGSNKLAGGAALFLTGLVTLTTPLWAAPTHVIDGFNTVNVLLWPLMGVGCGLTLWGGWLLVGLRKAGRVDGSALAARKAG